MKITNTLMEQGRRAARLVAAITQPRQREFGGETTAMVALLLTIAAYLDGRLPEYEEDILEMMRVGDSAIQDGTWKHIELVVQQMARDAGFRPRWMKGASHG